MTPVGALGIQSWEEMRTVGVLALFKDYPWARSELSRVLVGGRSLEKGKTAWAGLRGEDSLAEGATLHAVSRP